MLTKAPPAARSSPTVPVDRIEMAVTLAMNPIRMMMSWNSSRSTTMKKTSLAASVPMFHPNLALPQPLASGLARPSKSRSRIVRDTRRLPSCRRQSAALPHRQWPPLRRALQPATAKRSMKNTAPKKSVGFAAFADRGRPARGVAPLRCDSRDHPQLGKWRRPAQAGPVRGGERSVRSIGHVLPKRFSPSSLDTPSGAKPESSWRWSASGAKSITITLKRH